MTVKTQLIQINKVNGKSRKIIEEIFNSEISLAVDTRRKSDDSGNDSSSETNSDSNKSKGT